MHHQIRKSYIPREIFTHNKKSDQSHPFILTRLNIKRIVEDDIKRNIRSLHQSLCISTSNEEYIEDYISNIINKLYLLYVESDRVDVKY